MCTLPINKNSGTSDIKILTNSRKKNLQSKGNLISVTRLERSVLQWTFVLKAKTAQQVGQLGWVSSTPFLGFSSVYLHFKPDQPIFNYGAKTFFSFLLLCSGSFNKKGKSVNILIQQLEMFVANSRIYLSLVIIKFCKYI